MEQETKIIPAITIEPWATMAIPQLELKNILTYLAYKANKPVTFRWYTQDEGYSKDSVSVRIGVNDHTSELDGQSPVHIGETKYQLSDEQVILKLGIDTSEDSTILDEDFLTIGYVDHNRIIIPIELTATDNEAARGILAHIIEKAVGLLDFNVDGKIIERRDEMAKLFCRAFAANVKQRVTERQNDLRNSQRAAEQARQTIIEFERKRPVITKEMEFLKRLSDNPDPVQFRAQAKALVDLRASGDFTEITANDDGTIVATTDFITIEYAGHEFPLGRYAITIDNGCDVNIAALDDHPNAQYPHPHVAKDGYPCLGNIAGDIPNLLGSMHFSEALQLLHEFLCSYSSDGGPFEKIGAFDPTGEFVDEDDNSCENCDEACSPFCVGGCSNNESTYSSSDCSEYRSHFCYNECQYNQYCDLSPCDDCDDCQSEHCYLECQYNSTWQKHEPCQTEDCEFEECNEECPYYSKMESLTRKGTINASAGQG